MSKSYEQLKEEHAAKKKAEMRKKKEPQNCPHNNTIYLGDAIRDGKYAHEIQFCEDCKKFIGKSNGR